MRNCGPRAFNTSECVFVCFFLLALLLTSTACPPPPPDPKGHVVLIFSDVTSSLRPSESDEVASLTCGVLDSLLPGTQYYVYPIQIEAQKLEAVDEGRIVSEDIPTADKAVKDARRTKITDKLKELYGLIKSMKIQGNSYGKRDNHTCILYTLEFAQNFFKQFDRAKTEFELIYVSDMIEECNTTPMRQPVSLVQGDISEDIKLAQQIDLNLDLSNVRFTVIIPATNETYVTGGRPNLSDVRLFWENVLSHSGFKESLQNDEEFYFSSGLPVRFKPRQN